MNIKISIAVREVGNRKSIQLFHLGAKHKRRISQKMNACSLLCITFFPLIAINPRCEDGRKKGRNGEGQVSLGRFAMLGITKRV
jgi:hypothetical protein